MQSKRCPASRWLVGSVLILGYLLVGPVSAQNVPPVEEPYKRFFVWYHDQRSLAEKILNSLGLSKEEVGRSFALIAGISSYPQMPLSERELKPAAEDLRKLEDYLKNVELFDEIVLLKDQNFHYANLAFFLQTYFPERLKKFPKSRFLFAYSGHGITAGPNGYLLLSTARSLSDKQHSLNLTIVRELFNEVVELVEAGHYVLALLNSCYSGTFLKRPFGERHFFPKHGGAHAITAGGKELTWHDPKVGTGSIFFEKFFAGLNGQADLIPANGDGLITVDELATYLRQEIQISTDQTQNPQTGDLSKHGSLGGFFFLNRSRQVARGTIPEWTLGPRIPSGPAPTPSNRPPVARLAAPTESEVETAVLLDASESTDPDGDPLIYTWDFGDGTNAQVGLPRTTHRYTSPGNYTVRVTVNDGRGGSSSATAPVTVSLRVVLSDAGNGGKVLFEFDKAELRPAAHERLAVVVQALREQPALRAEVVGHSDAVGSDAYNRRLSQRRAEAVRNYLITQGLPAANIRSDWRGKLEPLASNATAEGRAQNRRVEITLRPLTEHQRLEEEKKWWLEEQQGLPKEQRELAKVYVERGQAHNALGAYQQAIRDFTSSIELDPQAADAYLWRSLAYSALGNAEQEAEDRQRYEEREAQEKKRQAVSAMPALNQAIERNPR